VTTPTPPDGSALRNPRQAPPFLPPPAEIRAAASWPAKRKKLAPWHIAVLAMGVPVIAFFTCIGAYTFTTHVFRAAGVAAATDRAAPDPKAHDPEPSRPAYDLAGFQAVIKGGEEQAFVSALGRLRADDRMYNFAAAVSDAPGLVSAANAWLAALGPANPPPAWQGEKVAYIRAAILARRAAKATEGGLTSANLGLLQKGQALTAQAQAALARAPGNAPRGS
jgi:hypothetical protein